MADASVVVVTGGCTGIGAGITRRLVEAGSRVFATYNTNDRGARGLVSECADLPGEVVVRAVDLVDEDLASVLDGAITSFGTIRHLVNCAAIVDSNSLVGTTMESIERTLRVNVAVPLLLVAALVERHDAGIVDARSIVNVSSVAERFRGPDSLAYEASKAALSQLTRGLAVDLAPRGIRVNAVAPGAIHTERKSADPAWDPAVVGRLVPAGRVGTPADVAEVVEFLVADTAHYVTGQVIYVDGGLSLRL